MQPPQLAVLVLTILLGLGTLGSYVPLVIDQVKGKYDYWLQFPKSSRIVFYVFQALAAVGFLTFFINYMIEPVDDKQGLLSYTPWVTPLILGILLLSCLIWGISVVQYMRNRSTWLKWVAVTSLVVTAIGALLLLAGYAETKEPKWYVLLGLLLFSIVTVLADGVMWNARFILSY